MRIRAGIPSAVIAVFVLLVNQDTDKSVGRERIASNFFSESPENLIRALSP